MTYSLYYSSLGACAEIPSYYLLISNIWMSWNKERIVAATLSLFWVTLEIIISRRQTPLRMKYLSLIWYHLTTCWLKHIENLEFKFFDVSKLVNHFVFKVFLDELLISVQYLASQLLKSLMVIQIGRFNVRDPAIRELRH